MQIPNIVKRILLVIGALVVIAGGLLIWQVVASHQKKAAPVAIQKKAVVVSHVCTDDVVKQASPLMASGGLSALGGVVADIEAKSNYQGDANCGYIRTSYYTATGNIDKAQAALDDMRFAREAGSEYSFSFDPPVPPLSELENAIAIQKTIGGSSQSANGSDLNSIDLLKTGKAQ